MIPNGFWDNLPFILFPIKNNKGLQFDIPYLKHNTYFNEAIECLKIQVPIVFTENVSLKSLIDLVNSRFNDNLVKSNSAQQAKLFEFIFYSSLFIGNQSQIQSVLNKVEQASKNWKMRMFEIWYGKFDIWLQGLREKVNSPEEFLKQIEANKQDKKIAKLQSSELTA